MKRSNVYSNKDVQAAKGVCKRGGGGGGGVVDDDDDDFFLEPAAGFSDQSLLSQITNKKIHDLLKLMRYQKNSNNLEIEIDNSYYPISDDDDDDDDGDDDDDDDDDDGDHRRRRRRRRRAAAAADDVDDQYRITILPSSFLV